MELPPLEPEAAPPSFEETVEYAPLGHRVAARLIDVVVHYGVTLWWADWPAIDPTRPPARRRADRGMLPSSDSSYS
ncbi:MAG TPA: hypothetical protein VNM67_05565 [Thermoanaerobaculia bacterium]|jgi:hypothetical protein|nr:hypothetical protein [Thermoanaerobaculia bacterium]